MDLEAWQARLSGEAAVHRCNQLAGLDTDVGEAEHWALMRETAMGGPDTAYQGPVGSSHSSAQRPFDARRLPHWTTPTVLPTREAVFTPRPLTSAEQQDQHDFVVKMAAARALLVAATEAIKGGV